MKIWYEDERVKMQILEQSADITASPNRHLTLAFKSPFTIKSMYHPELDDTTIYLGGQDAHQTHGTVSLYISCREKALKYIENFIKTMEHIHFKQVRNNKMNPDEILFVRNN